MEIGPKTSNLELHQLPRGAATHESRSPFGTIQYGVESLERISQDSLKIGKTRLVTRVSQGSKPLESIAQSSAGLLGENKYEHS